jgi:hypothetical protein
MLAMAACRPDTVEGPSNLGPFTTVKVLEPSANGSAVVLPVGGQTRVLLLGYDGHDQAIATGVSWQSRNPAIATASASTSTDAGSTIVGMSAGATYIVASVTNNSKVFIDSIRVSVGGQ